MLCVTLVLYALSVLLPLGGLFGLYRTAVTTVEEMNRVAGLDRKSTETGKWLVTEFFGVLRYEMLDRPRRIRGDFILIGGGVVCGAVASVLAVLVLP